MTYFTKTHLRTEQVAANETFPPMSGSLFMNFENSFHSWSMADCRSSDWSPDPSVNKFQTSTIFGQFELCLNTSSVTPENNCENLKNKKFFAGGLDLSFYVDIKIWLFFYYFFRWGNSHETSESQRISKFHQYQTQVFWLLHQFRFLRDMFIRHSLALIGLFLKRAQIVQKFYHWFLVSKRQVYKRPPIRSLKKFFAVNKVEKQFILLNSVKNMCNWKISFRF